MIKAVIFDMYETLITLFESPAYFGTQIAEDMGINEIVFRKTWDGMEEKRSIGKISLEEVLELIMRENHCYSMELLNRIAEKRMESKRECFKHMHAEIIPMLSELHKAGIKIGLISNCFYEEAVAIRESVLFPYFDAAYMSYEQGIQKPDKEIFIRCMKALEASPQECIYIGDGGSHELEAAQELGMNTFQATWYLKDGTTQPVKRKEDFAQLDTPFEVLKYI